jgi:hypothetical protein
MVIVSLVFVRVNGLVYLVLFGKKPPETARRPHPCHFSKHHYRQIAP